MCCYISHQFLQLFSCMVCYRILRLKKLFPEKNSRKVSIITTAEQWFYMWKQTDIFPGSMMLPFRCLSTERDEWLCCSSCNLYFARKKRFHSFQPVPWLLKGFLSCKTCAMFQIYGVAFSQYPISASEKHSSWKFHGGIFSSTLHFLSYHAYSMYHDHFFDFFWSVCGYALLRFCSYLFR